MNINTIFHLLTIFAISFVQKSYSLDISERYGVIKCNKTRITKDYKPTATSRDNMIITFCGDNNDTSEKIDGEYFISNGNRNIVQSGAEKHGKPVSTTELFYTKKHNIRKINNKDKNKKSYFFRYDLKQRMQVAAVKDDKRTIKYSYEYINNETNDLKYIIIKQGVTEIRLLVTDQAKKTFKIEKVNTNRKHYSKNQISDVDLMNAFTLQNWTEELQEVTREEELESREVEVLPGNFIRE